QFHPLAGQVPQTLARTAQPRGDPTVALSPNCRAQASSFHRQPGHQRRALLLRQMLQQDIEPLLHRIKRPRRPARMPRVYSMAEIEKLLTVGTEGNLRARAFLSCVYGGGLRLSEATHTQIKDLDGARR